MDCGSLCGELEVSGSDHAPSRKTIPKKFWSRYPLRFMETKKGHADVMHVVYFLITRHNFIDAALIICTLQVHVELRWWDDRRRPNDCFGNCRLS
jgi:hypothetical protein